MQKQNLGVDHGTSSLVFAGCMLDLNQVFCPV
jgi:hypothetical protein